MGKIVALARASDSTCPGSDPLVARHTVPNLPKIPFVALTRGSSAAGSPPHLRSRLGEGLGDRAVERLVHDLVAAEHQRPGVLAAQRLLEITKEREVLV